MTEISTINPKVYGESIYYYESALISSNNLVEKIEKTDDGITATDCVSKWEPWVSSDMDYVFGSKKTTHEKFYGTSSVLVKELYSDIIDVLTTTVSHYAEVNGISMGTMAPISIAKYDAGKSMGPHTDTQTGAHISAVLYINDNYNGGDIDFPNQEFNVKPTAGSVLVFPSVEPFVHSPNAATAPRYVATAFWFAD